MKKGLFVLVAAVLFATTSFSQSFNHVVKTGPLGLAFGNFNVKYEKPLNSSSSIQLGANYFYKFLGVELNGYGIEAGFRYYFTHSKKEIPTGFYVMPEVQYSAVGSGVDKLSVISVGAEVGYQWAFESGFTIDLGAGPLYNIINMDEANTTAGLSYTDNYVFPTLTFAIGYAF